MTRKKRRQRQANANAVAQASPPPVKVVPVPPSPPPTSRLETAGAWILKWLGVAGFGISLLNTYCQADSTRWQRHVGKANTESAQVERVRTAIGADFRGLWSWKALMRFLEGQWEAAYSVGGLAF